MEKWKAAKKIVGNNSPSELRLPIIQEWAIQLVEKGISAGRDAALEEAAKIAQAAEDILGDSAGEVAERIRELKEQK